MDGRKNNSGKKGNSGGKSLNDRALMAQVRNLTLMKIRKLLEQNPAERSDHETKLYSGVLLKLSSQVLPRLQYVSDGEGESLFPAPLSEGQLDEMFKRREEAKKKKKKTK